MISTKELHLLPDSNTLRKTCRAMAVLDAILCQDWVYRYHSYNSEWSEDEEFFEMRNGEGDGLLILFKKEGTAITGAAINGYFAEAEQPDKMQLKERLPEMFHEFIFGEPVNSAGTTFCLWKTEGNDWENGITAEGGVLSDNGVPANEMDHSKELLSPFDGKPETYVKWASGYFKGQYKNEEISLETVRQIYQQEPLSKEMVLMLVEQLEDWELLAEDLAEIAYPNQLEL